MPSYIGYSPWQDAAQFGQGLGQTLAQILFRVPELRAQREREGQELDLRRREIDVRERLNDLHGKLYLAQAEAVPKRLAQQEAALGLRQQDVQTDNIRADQLARSTMGLREKQGAYYDTRNSLLPQQFDATQKKTAAELDYLQTRNALYPEQIRNERQRINMQLEDMGYPAMPGITWPPPAPPPSQQVPPPSLAPMFLQSDSPPAVPLSMPMLQSDSPPAVSSPMPNMIRIRDRRSGRTGWATPDELQRNPDLIPLPQGRG